MSGRKFFDTNIFVYADDAREPIKQKIAREILREAIRHREAIVSSQVVLEFAANLIRVLGRNPTESAERIRMFESMHCVSVTPKIAIRGLDLMKTHSISVWDSTIIAAALEAGCETLYSEDFSSAMKLDGLPS